MTAHPVRPGHLGPDSQAAFKTYKVAGEYRRSLLYLVAGGVVIVATAALTGQQPIDPRRIAALAGIYILLPLLAWLYATTWRLRVDEVGLWRQRLGWWTCWTWEEIASGRVRRGRMIGLGFLGKEGAFAVDLVTAALPKEPTPEETARHLPVPTEVMIVTWFPFQRIRFHAQGLDVHRAWSFEMYRWDDVAELRVVRYPHGDFLVHRVEVDLSGGGKVRGDLTSVRVSDQWDARPHRKEATWAFSLQQIVPPAQWRLFDAIGELKSVEEAAFRIQFWQKRRRIMKWFQWAGFAVLPFMAWQFVPAMLAVWNMPFLPFHWKIITTICGLLSMSMHPFLLYVVAKAFGDRMLARERESVEQLRELAKQNGLETPAAAA